MERRELGQQRWREAFYRMEYEFYRGMQSGGAQARAQQVAEKLAPEMQADAPTGILFSRKVAPGGGAVIAEPFGISFTQPLPAEAKLEYDANCCGARLQVRGASGVPLAATIRHECCSETFRDGSIPALERALTYYLYWKLFPNRFDRRFHP